MSSGQQVKLSDDEITLLVFGQRRLATKLRGDLRYWERRDPQHPLVKVIGRQTVETRQLHARLMDICRARGIVVPVHTEGPQQ